MNNVIELLSFPNEIIFHILEFVKVRDLIKLTIVSKKVRNYILTNLCIWKKVIYRNWTTNDYFFKGIKNVDNLITKLKHFKYFINITFLNEKKLKSIKSNMEKFIINTKTEFDLNFVHDDLLRICMSLMKSKIMHSVNSNDMDILFNFAIENGLDLICEKMLALGPDNLCVRNFNAIIKKLLLMKHTKLIKFIIRNYDCNYSPNYVLRWSARYGNKEIVELLLNHPRVKPGHTNNQTIQWAVNANHKEIVELLLSDSRVDPSDNANLTFSYAVVKNNLEIVNLLLKDPRINPGDRSNKALKTAIKHGYEEIVKILLKHPKVSVTSNIGPAIAIALKNNHENVVKLVLAETLNNNDVNTIDIMKEMIFPIVNNFPKCFRHIYFE